MAAKGTFIAAFSRLDGALANRWVLVLEDEVLIALELQMLLEERGAHVAQAFTVAEALDAVEAGRVEAAILDVNLGAETCEPVAARLRELGAPFLLYTGDFRGEGELVERLGAPVVAKPAGEGEVIDRLAELVRR